MLSPYGWVTKKAYEADHDTFVSRQEYARHLVDFGSTQIKVEQANDKLDRVIAYTEIVPELKVQLRLRCMGSTEVQATINRLQGDFFELMGRYYEEPTCEELLSGQ
jgi:hypothetical protein